MEINYLHEASHAVAAAAVSLRVGGISPNSCLLEKSDSVSDKMRTIISTLCPFFIDPEGSDPDLKDAAASICELQSNGIPFTEEFYTNAARDLMSQQRVIQAIKTLAAALEQRQNMNGDEITALIEPILFKEGDIK
jgi:hypothetical protein